MSSIAIDETKGDMVYLVVKTANKSVYCTAQETENFKSVLTEVVDVLGFNIDDISIFVNQSLVPVQSLLSECGITAIKSPPYRPTVVNIAAP